MKTGGAAEKLEAAVRKTYFFVITYLLYIDSRSYRIFEFYSPIKKHNLNKLSNQNGE